MLGSHPSKFPTLANSRPTRLSAVTHSCLLPGSHALESYTALPYTERLPRPSNPRLRPAYQGSNPISDVWSKHALRIVAKYMKRSVGGASRAFRTPRCC